MLSMLGFKVKFVFLCLTASLVAIHWSQAVENDEEFDDEDNLQGFRMHELTFDDLRNEEARNLHTSFDVKRIQSRRRRVVASGGRVFACRRRVLYRRRVFASRRRIFSRRPGAALRRRTWRWG